MDITPEQTIKDVWAVVEMVDELALLEPGSAELSEKDSAWLDQAMSMPDGSWKNAANCVEQGFGFLDPGYQKRYHARAKAICGSCAVRAQCALNALSTYPSPGYAAGLPKYRRAEVRRILGYPNTPAEVVTAVNAYSAEQAA